MVILFLEDDADFADATAEGVFGAAEGFDVEIAEVVCGDLANNRDDCCAQFWFEGANEFKVFVH